MPLKELRECSKPIVCQLCFADWLDSEQQKPWFTLLNSVTTIRHILESKQCPNYKCGIRIQKISGCPHIKCTNCQYQWCWHCRSSFFKYKHTNEKTCETIRNATQQYWMIVAAIVLIKVNIYVNFQLVFYWMFIFILALFTTIIWMMITL